MNYPRFSDDGCDGYHPGEEQPAMHNDEPQKPVTIPAGDELIAEMLAGLEGVTPGEWAVAEYSSDIYSPAAKITIVKGWNGTVADLAHIARCSPQNIRALIARTAADGAVEPDVAALVEKLSSAKANGDPNKYIAFVTVAEAHQAAAALTALQQRAETLERERATAHAGEVYAAKLMLRFRDTLANIVDGVEDEGDRVYFGSTNAADELREISEAIEELAWDKITASSQKKPDLYADLRQLRTDLAAAEAALASAERRVANLERELAHLSALAHPTEESK